MKYLSNIKMVNTFKEVSNALEIMSLAVKLFTIAIVVFQAVKLASTAKNTISGK